MPKIQNMGASTPTLVAHPTREALAADAVTRILDIIEHVLSERTIAHISLTGGTMGIATLKAWAENERVKDIDWSRVHFWFSDERYVPERSPERNDGQAIEVLLAPLLSHGLVVGNVHRMGPSDIFTGLEAAAEHYAFEMRDYAGCERADARGRNRTAAGWWSRWRRRSRAQRLRRLWLWWRRLRFFRTRAVHRRDHLGRI